ncbi:MAG: glycosyl hydrolase [bacterium]
MKYAINGKLWFFRLALTLFLPVSSTLAAPETGWSVDMEKSFTRPSVEAKPWVYWFWMNGNVTQEGITADLEAMNRVGIGGALMMGVGLGTPPGEADFNSPLWRSLYVHAAKEAVRLGMRLVLHQCDGWATAGGPWITPDRSMKMLVWSTKEIEGTTSGSIKLDKPLTKEGFYEEVSLLAVPLGDKTAQVVAAATLDGKPAPLLTDGNCSKGQMIGKKTELRLNELRTISTLVFHQPNSKHSAAATIELSVDGKTFRQVAAFDIGASIEGRDQESLTVSFAPTEARAIRILCNNPPESEIGEIEVLAEPRVNLWEMKSGWARRRDHGGETPWLADAPAPLDIAGVNPNLIVDLNGKLSPDGTLDWEPPAGRWLIVRAGMTSTAKHVAPRTNAGEGLEADKMSGEAIRFHFDSFAKGMIAENNLAKGNPIYSVHTDSWESNIHTWSTGFRQEFEKRRGYSPIKWLPVLTSGLIIGSAEESERFLWDVRRTMADLIRDNFYGEMLRKCHENGVLFQSESAGRQMFMYDPINYSAMTDIPIGEFWMKTDLRVDCKVAASVAHIYNRPIVGAEAFTSGDGGFHDDPFALKVLGDRAFCEGINRYIIHRYCMQPFNTVEPGMTFGPWGINFERTQTWWENGGKAWVEYVTRCQSLLQAGMFVADVIHYIGDDAPNFLGHREDLWNPVPQGYDFDGCNLEILKQLNVDTNGYLMLPHGMRYRVLLLPSREHMTLEALRKIEMLVNEGATVLGPRPIRTPGLKDWKQNDAVLCEIAGRLWGKIDGKTVTENRYGQGRVIYGSTLESVLKSITPPDFDYTAATGVTLSYIHRKTATADFYFVANGDNSISPDATVRFRVTGKVPELWDASTGKMSKAVTCREVNGVTELSMHFDPAGSVFVVFRERATPQAQCSITLAAPKSSTTEVMGPWTVSFPPGKQAPEHVTLSKLVSWTESADEGVKYFSGTATYRKTFDVPESKISNGKSKILLDLGQVKNVAEVSLNGEKLGTLWKPPFAVDVTRVLKSGTNELEIKVTNLWPNRLIGDSKLHPDPSLDYGKNRKKGTENGPLKTIPDWVKHGGKSPVGRTTFILRKAYNGSEPLLESGLLGPVTLQVSSVNQTEEH